MVIKSDLEVRYTLVAETDLDELLQGKDPGQPLRAGHPPHIRIDTGKTLAILKRGFFNEPWSPVALVTNENDLRRLCGRYAQLHSDLSPLSAWCHLLTPEFFAALSFSSDNELPERVPVFNGMRAA